MTSPGAEAWYSLITKINAVENQNEIMKTALAAIAEMAQSAPDDAEFRYGAWALVKSAMSKISKGNVCHGMEAGEANQPRSI